MSLEERLTRIETLLVSLSRQQHVRDFYSIAEFALLVGRSEFTCREWCRLKRIRATKKISGRGAHAAWVISHDELQRYRREGLLRADAGGNAGCMIEGFGAPDER